MREKMYKSPETAFPGDLTLCLILKKFSKDKKSRTVPLNNFFEKMTVPRLIFRRSEVFY